MTLQQLSMLTEVSLRLNMVNKIGNQGTSVSLDLEAFRSTRHFISYLRSLVDGLRLLKICNCISVLRMRAKNKGMKIFCSIAQGG